MQNVYGQNNVGGSGNSSSQIKVDLKNVIEITDLMEFFAIADNNKALIIDFYADFCGPCKLIKPIFCDYSEQFLDIKFYSVDGQKQADLAQ